MFVIHVHLVPKLRMSETTHLSPICRHGVEKANFNFTFNLYGNLPAFYHEYSQSIPEVDRELNPGRTARICLLH
jgi:hypothetical protein